MNKRQVHKHGGSYMAHRYEIFFSLLSVVCVTSIGFLSVEALAASSNVIGVTGIENVIKTLVALLTGTVAKGISLIAIVGLGFAAWSGRLTGALAIKIIIGICIILGAGELIEAITGKTTTL